jgi:hypothetical protein
MASIGYARDERMTIFAHDERTRDCAPAPAEPF